MMSNLCWPHRAQCIKDCLILYIRKLNLFKHIVQDWKTTTSAVHLHLRNQCQTVYRGRTEKTGGLQGIKEVIYVKLYPCTAGGGWGIYDISYELLTMPSWHLYIHCFAPIQTQKAIVIHSTRQVIPSVIKIHTFTEAIPTAIWSCLTRQCVILIIILSSNYWVTFHVILNYLHLKLRFCCSILKASWKYWVFEQTLN